LGVLGTAPAYSLHFRIPEVAGSSNLMLVTIIVPVFVIILDGMLLSQFVTGSDLFGFALVAIGVFIMDGRLNHNLLRKG
jgi:drug/metabolite transporter (DMT)-like permease